MGKDSFERMAWLAGVDEPLDLKERIECTHEGQRILQEAMSRYVGEDVLIEVWPDGFIKVFGDRTVRVKIVQRPEGEEALVDEWVESQLPLKFKGVYYPSGCRAMHQVARVSVDDLEYREWYRRLWNSVSEAERVLKAAREMT